MDIAKRLAACLEAEGAVPLLIRTGDEAVAAAERVRRASGADCVVSLHTGHAPGRAVQGTRTLYAPASPGGRELAERVHRGVVRKIRRPDRGVSEGTGGLPGPFPWPAVTVEAVCIANPVEEGWLRSPVFKDRIARGICNGLKDFFAWREEAAAR